MQISGLGLLQLGSQAVPHMENTFPEAEQLIGLGTGLLVPSSSDCRVGLGLSTGLVGSGLVSFVGLVPSSDLGLLVP